MTLKLSTMLDTPNANQQDKRGTTRLREEKARDRLSIHLGCCGHAFMRLAWQCLDADVRQDGSEGVSDVEVTRAFRADLQ
jgi:hypothetical protein